MLWVVLRARLVWIGRCSGMDRTMLLVASSSRQHRIRYGLRGVVVVVEVVVVVALLLW